MSTTSTSTFPTAGENKRKHMEFVQNVITRMNGNSFLIKGWTVTLISALFALSADKAQTSFVFIAAISLPVFWGLDAYYLSMEKQYRVLFEAILKKEELAIDFNMKLPKEITYNNTWLYCLITRTIWPVYTCITVGAILVYLLLNHVIKF